MLDVLHGATTAFFLKVLAAALALGFNVVLGRTLGAEAAGIYFLALSTATIAAVIGRAGLDASMVRFIAANAAIENWPAVNGVYRTGLKIALVCSGTVAVVVALGADVLAGALFSDAQVAGPIRLMALSVVPLALSVLHSQALKGLSRIRDSLLVFSVLPMLVALVGTIALTPTWDLRGAIAAYVVAVMVALAYGWVSWRRATLAVTSVPADFTIRKLMKSSTPLFWASLLNLVTVWSSTFMLGIWADMEDVGIFAVAARTAALISFVLAAVNSIAGPKFAALYKTGNMQALNTTARHSAFLVTVFALPAFLVLILIPETVMALFGNEFSQGGGALQVLAIGQFVNVVTGSVAFLLMMCGYERIVLNNQIVTAILALVLNALLIPTHGVIGAAIASASALITQNLLAAYFVWRKLGIVTIPRWQRDRDGATGRF